MTYLKQGRLLNTGDLKYLARLLRQRERYLSQFGKTQTDGDELFLCRNILLLIETELLKK